MSIIPNHTDCVEKNHLEHALELAERGFFVFPLEPGTKMPAIDKYPERATRDPEHIRRWWTCPVIGTPLDRNIAISTTRYSDAQALLVIDVDQKQGKDGNASLAALEAAHGALPATLEASTPSGGRHLFFAVDAAVPQSAGKLGDGLDIRGRGGYVVAAGSTTDQGRYEWLNDHPVNTAPDWLVRWCWKDAGARAERTAEPVAPIEVNEALAVERALDYLRHHAPEGYEGARDETAFKVACRLRDFGVDELTTLDLMRDHWPCYPMLENLEHPVHSAYTYAKGVMGGDAPEAQFSPVEVAAPEMMDVAKSDPLAELAKFSLTGSSGAMEAKMEADVHVLGRVAVLGEGTVFYAPPNVGKTLGVWSLLIEAIEKGSIAGKNVYYINADDGFKGVVTKLKLAEVYEINMLVPGQNGFKATDLLPIIGRLVESQQARGQVFVLDTAKKFTDLMDKKASSKFCGKMREFMAAGGTVILLAHCNKHRDSEGRLVYAGTTDLEDDMDCTYVIDTIREAEGVKVIEFQNRKYRGDVDRRASYQYRCNPSVPWMEKLESFGPVSSPEAEAMRETAKRETKEQQDRPVIEAIQAAIAAGKGENKTRLIGSAKKISEASRRMVIRVLDEYRDVHWREEVGEKNAHRYVLIGDLPGGFQQAAREGPFSVLD